MPLNDDGLKRRFSSRIRDFTRGGLLSAGALLALFPGAWAAETDATEYASLGSEAKSEFPPLPPAVAVEQSIQLNGHPLRYCAAVGALPVRNENGRIIAEVVHTDYTVKGAGDSRRPVTFVFAGGPAVASGALNLGGIGPKWVRTGLRCRGTTRAPGWDSPI
jgi:carboxypeptidase C (cathepsin A)